MTKMFGNLSNDGLEEATDRVGGFSLKDTGIYTGTVKLAYATTSKNGAQGVAVHIDLGGHELRQTLWVTKTTGENFYVDKDKKKQPLMGYTLADDLCLVTTGFGLADQDVEEKVVKLWDSDSKRETNQNVACLVDVMGKEVSVAVFKQTVDKNEKNAAGVYVPNGETREENEIDKFFHTDTRRTVVEIKAGLDDGVHWDAWETKWKGRIRNKAKGAANGAGGNAGAPGRPGGASAGAAGGTQAPKSSLFGSKPAT